LEVRPEVQWFLVEALSNARGSPRALDDYESKQQELVHFAGVLSAFTYLEELTPEEKQTWADKMLVALGYKVPGQSPDRISRAIYVGDPAKIAARQTPPKSPPVFVRSQPGPDEEFEVHGGRLRVIAIEFYDSVIAIRWRVSPLPDVTSAFPDEAAALEQDLVGLEEWAAEELRQKGHQRLAMMRLYSFGLADDLNTPYIQMGSNHGGGGNEMAGEARFKAPPSEATVLTFSWLGFEVPITIT
jgi:hypothetical protein